MDFNQALLISSGITNATLIEADLSLANLTSVSLIDCDLTGANLSGANLLSTTFSGSTLKYINLNNALMSATTTFNNTEFVEIGSSLTTNQAMSLMRDLRIGSQVFEASEGMVSLQMFIDESGDLISWTNTPHVLELDIPADTDTKFFRFRMD